MTGTERVLAVLDLQQPDCVPTFEWDIDSGVIDAMTGGGTYEDFLERFGHDAVMAGADYAKTPLGPGLLQDEWGVVRRRGREDYAMPVDAEAPIQTPADLAAYNPPDPLLPARFDTLAARAARFKGDKCIFVRLRDVFSGPRELMGYERLLAACIAEPEFVRNAVEMCVDHSISLARRAAQCGAEVVMTGDDFADGHGLLLAPDIWRALFLPPLARLAAAVHDAGLHFWKHTDGNVTEIMDDLVAAGIDGIDPVDPSAGMDLAAVKRHWGDRVAIKGNVDCAHLLCAASPRDVDAAVRDCIRAAGGGGGYVCSSSNSIHSGVKPELYMAMLDAIRRYGAYPLSV